MKKKKKKKSTKGKKKFFIILSCYIATFLITSFITGFTMAWFGGSTWQDNAVYMGGPVYIYFSDNTETNITSGAETLVSHLPATYKKIYPGMNIIFEAKAVFVGHTFHNTTTTGDDWTQYSSAGVLRARIMIDVYDPRTGGTSSVSQDIYDWLWPQFRDSAMEDETTTGMWVFDEINMNKQENNYFYYVQKDQGGETNNSKMLLHEVGGKPQNEAVDFLNSAVIQFPGMELTNAHSDCSITFTIVFESVQAYFPYEQEEVGVALYQGDTTGRDIYVTQDDVGLGKPLTLENSRKLFEESKPFDFPEEETPEPEPEPTE